MQLTYYRKLVHVTYYLVIFFDRFSELLLLLIIHLRYAVFYLAGNFVLL